MDRRLSPHGGCAVNIGRGHASARVIASCVLWFLLPAVAAQSQTMPAGPTPAASQRESWNDVLGRATPRGTVIGFLNAARAGNLDLASRYLNTRLTGKPAEALARRLFTVLDARLPARLTQISDKPEGSRLNPLSVNLETVGKISSANGDVDIVVELVPRGNSGPIWLFTSTTLDSIQDVYAEIALEQDTRFLPRIANRIQIGSVRLLEWVAVMLGLVILYLATVLLNWGLNPLIRFLWRRAFKKPEAGIREILPVPARLLLTALWSAPLLNRLPLSLYTRQFWTHIASLVTIGAVVWVLIRLNGAGEHYIARRFPSSNISAGADLLRLGRRTVSLLIVFAGLIAVLRHFGVDPKPALAGLGVGGIAIALAAQKTLENVIAGVSLIFDQAVHVGDTLKMGDVVGTVDHIGLRSTRIRTLDRTMVSIPNSQIANASLETLSARDMYYFHPTVGLRYETTPEQLRSVVDGIRRLLVEHQSVDPASVRVRFVRLGSFSLDVDVMAYVAARDWNHFLAIQEQLLFSVTEAVEKAGAAIAFPSQTMYVSGDETSLRSSARPR